MPYDSVAELPAYVRKMPAEKQRQWMAVFNSAMKDGDSEEVAFRKANGVVHASEPMEFMAPGQPRDRMGKWTKGGAMAEVFGSVKSSDDIHSLADLQDFALTAATIEGEYAYREGGPKEPAQWRSGDDVFLTHAVRYASDIDGIIGKGLDPGGYNAGSSNYVWGSEGFVRTIGSNGFVVMRVPKSRVVESRDVLEEGLAYPERRIAGNVPPKSIVKVVRAVDTGGGHTIREDVLADYILKNKLTGPEYADLPPKYKHWADMAGNAPESFAEPELGTPEWFHKMLKADLQRAAEPEHQGNFIGIWLDGSTAGSLAMDGGEPPEELHITLLYDPDGSAENLPAILAAVTRVALEWEELEGTINGRGRFYGDGQDVIYAAPDVPGLSALRQELVEATGLGDTEHGWTPHITLQYIDPDEPTPFSEPLAFFNPYHDATGRFAHGSGGVGYKTLEGFDASGFVAGLENSVSGTMEWREFRNEYFGTPQAKFVNGTLRAGKSDALANRLVRATERASVELPEGISTFRGALVKSEVLAALKPGALVRDGGFTSTTLNKAHAESFLKRKQWAGEGATSKMLVEVRLPKGTKVIPNGGESELALPAGSVYRVASKRGKNVVLEYLGQSE